MFWSYLVNLKLTVILSYPAVMVITTGRFEPIKFKYFIQGNNNTKVIFGFTNNNRGVWVRTCYCFWSQITCDNSGVTHRWIVLLCYYQVINKSYLFKLSSLVKRTVITSKLAVIVITVRVLLLEKANIRGTMLIERLLLRLLNHSSIRLC